MQIAARAVQLKFLQNCGKCPRFHDIYCGRSGYQYEAGHANKAMAGAIADKSKPAFVEASRMPCKRRACREDIFENAGFASVEKKFGASSVQKEGESASRPKSGLKS